MKHQILDRDGKEYSLRIAKREDLSRLNEIYNEAIRTRRCTGHMVEFAPEERLDWFLAHPEDKYPIYVCETDGKIIGYVHISPYKERHAFEGDVEITYYLDFDHHGLGIGSAMMDFMLKRTKELGYEFVIATLLSLNEKSIGLLEKFGFSRWGRLPQIMNMGGGTRCDFLIYGLKL